MPAPPESRPAALKTGAATTLTAVAQSDEALARAMVASVKALLDAVPRSRKVLQGLAAVEHALATDSLEGIDWLPQSMLEKACAQLQSLPVAPDDQILPQLLELMQLAIMARTALYNPGALRNSEFMSSFLNEEKLVVSEGSHTDFVRLSLDDPQQNPR